MAKNEKKYCRNCDKQIITNDKRRRVFCCDTCKQQWWIKHKNLANRKSQITVICKYCGNPFKAYEADERLFCSRKCYLRNKHENNSKWIEKEKSLKWQIAVTCCLLKKLVDEYENMQ